MPQDRVAETARSCEPSFVSLTSDFAKRAQDVHREVDVIKVFVISHLGAVLM